MANLKSIWENCYQQFSATLTHEQNILHILSKIEDIPNNELCACPMIDLLIHQGISPSVFGAALCKWFFALEKRNVLLFKGPQNTGKSTIARIIWDQFLLHQRIVNDGIFSFGNAPGSGCLLWEETHIPPELADITKLIMEGEPTVAVAIKNKPSQMLNKRIPMLITNNHELGVYCPHEQPNFDARCFKFDFPRQITPELLCTNKVHYCDSIDTVDHTSLSSQSAPCHQPEATLSEDSVEDCTKFHKLTTKSFLTFMILSLYNNPRFLAKLRLDVKLENIRVKYFNICQSSRLNYD